MGERPWIEHDGKGCPFIVGQVVDAMNRDGRVLTRTVKTHHFSINYNGLYGAQLNPLFWAVNGRLSSQSFCDVIAYRLHDDGQSEAETRKARMDQFYKIAAGKDHLIEETLKTRKPVSAPQKAGE